MAAGAYYACTIGRSRVALCLPGASYQPLYWFTRYLTLILNVCSKILSLSSFPQKLSPWLNLTKLMTPTSWACILASILSVVFCFNAGSVVLKKKMGIGMKFIELNLYPFRFEKISPCLIKYIYSFLAFRVYFPSQEHTIGLHSFNLLWLMWAVCGGLFITNFILCNYLQVLLKEVYEIPVDTSKVCRFKNEYILILSHRMFSL